MANNVDDFIPIKSVGEEAVDYHCPMGGFWLRSHVCRSCSNYETEDDKCYCLAGR